MYEQQLESRYRNLANRLVVFCAVLFSTLRTIAELIDGSKQDAIVIAAASAFVIGGIILMQKKNINNLPLYLPIFIYFGYLCAAFQIDSFKYIYDFYLICLLVSAIYFCLKNYLIMVALTQTLNIFLSIYVLPNHVNGNPYVHYALLLGSSLILFMILRLSADKANEVNRAFMSFDALMKTTPNILVLLDGQNKIKYMSRSASKVFTKDETPEKWTGKNLLDLFDDPDTKDQFHRILNMGTFYESHIKVNIGDGSKTYDVAAGKIKENDFDGIFLHINDVSELARLKDLAEQESLTDGLTQIPNRRAFDKQVLYEWNHALREQVNLSFLMIDIDFFKKYNDTYGHTQGDVLLKTMGRIFKSTLKRSTDFAARLGGEEFGVLLHATNAYQAGITAERIRKAVEDEIIPTSNGEQTRFSISIGLCSTIPQKGSNFDVIVEEADKALYKAKDNGRNQVCAANLS